MEDPEEVLTTVTRQPLMSIEDEEVAVVHQEVGEAMNLAQAIEVDPQIVEVTEAEVLMNEVYNNFECTFYKKVSLITPKSAPYNNQI